MISEGTTGTATQSHKSLPRGGMLTSFLWYLGFAVIKSFHVKEGAHFKSQLQRKVQLSSAPRGEERKAKISYSPYNKTIKQDYLKNHTNNSNVHCSRDYHFFNLLFFHKTPQPPKSVPLSSAYHSDPFWPHVPIFLIAPLQLSKASTVLLKREAEIINLSPLLTFQNVIFDSTWVMWSVFTVCSCQGFLGCSSTVSWVPPVPHTSSSSNTPQPHRRVIPDSQCKPALSCFPKPQSQSSDPACCRAQTQSTSKIKLCDQASFTKGNFSPPTPEHKRISGQSQG